MLPYTEKVHLSSRFTWMLKHHLKLFKDGLKGSEEIQSFRLIISKGILKIFTLLSVLMWTFNKGRTLSTSSFHSAASVVDSITESGLDESTIS